MTKIENTEKEQTNDEKELPAISSSLDQSKTIETYLTQFLKEEEVQSQIRDLIQSAIKDELSKLSIMLKEAIRDWIFKEKEKYRLNRGHQIESSGNEREGTKEILKLNEEVEALKRQLELKTHENQLITSALKKMMDSKKQK